MATFSKYQGLGNDFVVIDVIDPGAIGDAQARAICDRHFGVGADGVLLVSPGSADTGPSMHVINADGSRPEMCGNGLRCVALHLARRDEKETARYVVTTDAGPLTCDVHRDGNVAEVTIDMGSARDVGRHVSRFAGADVSFHRISTGNPHAIHFDSRYDLAQIDALGPQVSAELPEGSNVEFVTTRPDGSLELVVWERGVGRTLACGTGACATVVAAALARRVPFSEDVTVHLPGGSLRVAVGADDLTMRMSGPAAFVFDGSW